MTTHEQSVVEHYRAALESERRYSNALGELAGALLKYVDLVEEQVVQIRSGLQSLAKATDEARSTPPPADPWVRFSDAFPPE
jgi:hypothetical protein